MIRSELKYSIAAKGAGTLKWNCGPGTTRAKHHGFMSGWGNNPAKIKWFWFLAVFGTKPNRQPKTRPLAWYLDPLLTLHIVLAMGLGLHCKKGSVWFQTPPRTPPTGSYWANPGTLPSNLWFSPGLARSIGSILRFCILGFIFLVRFRYATDNRENIDIGTSQFIFDLLATLIGKTITLTNNTISSNCVNAP